MASEQLIRTSPSRLISTLMPGSCLLGQSDQEVEASFSVPLESLVLNKDHSSGKSRLVQDVEFQFNCLIERWHDERGALSSITDMAMCPSYQRIIAMGQPVVPLILSKMESEGDEPDMWFWALRILSNEDPVADQDRGDVLAMAQSWLDWGHDRYVW